LLVVLAGSAFGCALEDEDPLSSEALQRIARAQGDAAGEGFSGDYILGGEPQGCDCPEIEDFALCEILAVNAPILAADVSHYDGLVVVEISGTIDLIGGVDSDGTFAVASILDATVIGTGGELLSLAEGVFSEDGFTAELTNRFAGTYLEQAIDCRASSILTAVAVP